MGERDGNSHPVPGILLVVWGFVPVRHEQKCLDEKHAVVLVIEIVEQPSLDEEGFSGGFARRVSSRPEMFHRNERGTRKHHGLEKQQPGPSMTAVLGIDNPEKLRLVQERHVRMHEVKVCLQ